MQIKFVGEIYSLLLIKILAGERTMTRVTVGPAIESAVDILEHKLVRA